MTLPAPPEPTHSLAISGNPDEGIVAFNVLETSNLDLLKAFAWIFHSDAIAGLRHELQKWAECENVFLCPSGECGIAQVLSLLPQKEVVMPAWICHQVKTAVKLAGKRIIFVDLGKNNINSTSAEYEEAAKPGRILLIAHLFGVPTDVVNICELAKRRDCLTIEDAVPAIGGRQNGRLLGTFADFGVFSFEQSKRLSAFRGGFIVANNEHLCDLAKLDSNRLVGTTRPMPYLHLAKAFLQNFVTNPLIYRQITRRLLPLRPSPQNILRVKERKIAPPAPYAQKSDAPEIAPQTQFYTKDMHPYQAYLALQMIRRIDTISEQIAELARVYEKHFRGTPIQTFLPAGYDPSGLLRFPIALPGRNRSEIIRLSQERGVYLKTMWIEEESCAGLPNCIWAANNLIMLPLYTALSTGSARQIAETLLDVERALPR